MKNIKHKTHSQGVTTITEFAPDEFEREGVRQAESVLNFINTLDSGVYGYDCLRDSVMEQYLDILLDCAVVGTETFEESIDNYLARF